MKKILCKTLLVALMAAVMASSALAKDPKKSRRTLFATVGQRQLVLEAPTGMCFLDESDYLEGQLLRRYRDLASLSGSGTLIATFADCMEISKFQGEFQDQLAEQSKGGGSGSAAQTPSTLASRGSIFWANPGTGGETIDMSREEYLNVREQSFREEMVRGVSSDYARHGSKQVASAGGNFMVMSYLASPDQYHFDNRAHRTPDSLSIAYTMDTEIEYQKLHTAGIAGTTLLRQMPIEFTLAFSTKRSEKDMAELYSLMDTFLSQQVVLNGN
jgi:hypothetical protein